MTALPPGPYFVDANVPMYAAGAPHPYREPCQRILLHLTGGGVAAVTDSEVHQEILHRYISLGRAVQAVEVSEDFEQAVPRIIDIGIAEIREARLLVPRYGHLAARDLIHLAVLRLHGIPTIVTADMGFDRIPDIVRLDPIAFAASLPQ